MLWKILGSFKKLFCVYFYNNMSNFAQIALIVILLSIPMILSSKLVYAQESYSSYESPDSSYTIQYPSNWELDNTLNNPVTFSVPSDDLSESQHVTVTVTVINNPKCSDLRNFVNCEISNLMGEVTGLENVKSFPTNLAQRPAVALLYSDSGPLDDNAPEASLEVNAIDSNTNNLYNIKYSASPELFNSYIGVAQHMISSLAIPNSR
jgi:hypothetical protein